MNKGLIKSTINELIDVDSKLNDIMTPIPGNKKEFMTLFNCSENIDRSIGVLRALLKD
jgi:K+/H+ antiporter YhaU regulatory subunit KhtT